MAAIKVEGMSCGHCASVITKAINSVAPGAKVDVDIERQEVRVDGDADEASLRTAIREAGYVPV